MATYAYIRTSTTKQDNDNQRHGILEFANSKQLGTVEILEETVSGTVSADKRLLSGLLDKLQKDDVLIVSELSRLGRSMLEVMEILSILTKRGCKVHAIKGGYELGDNIQSKVLAFAFSLAAEIERELISSRTKESLAKKKAAGVVLGRPVGSISKSKLDGREEDIKSMLGHGVAKSAIARMLNCSRITLLDFIKSRGLEQK